ncbi:hypothetical protein DFH07DRAFT_976998 [Mycena maculata]|uniref:Uncharacterized protein n=1 Tax=Mycena maculata TaxID=230809 RepID=A0AAD7IP47_9AGAR|nr:hypothetical protein DFH07DRAFT_976998 [Mycena maculata]
MPEPFQSAVLDTVLAALSKELSVDTSEAYNDPHISSRLKNEHGVHKARLAHGYFAGWACLADTSPQVALPRELAADVLTSLRVYDTILPMGQVTSSTDVGLRMTISRAATYQDSIYHVAPKNLGGKAWRSSDEYLSVQRTWSNTGFEPLSPCVSFGWLGTQRKAIARNDLDDCDAMTLLGAVDFDMDLVESLAPAFVRAIGIANSHIAESGSRMQGAALAALLNYDVQHYVRRIQEDWVRNGRGAANFGPHMISPEDWVAALVADSTSLCAYGYQGAVAYTPSKAGSFVGLLLSNTHDLLYDLATSNLMSSVMYAAAAAVTKDDLHCIFVTSFMDGIARRYSIGAMHVPSNSLFGDNAMFAAGVWAGFSERYRTWERFVKYSRQISRSPSAEARNIEENARHHRILADFSLLDVAGAWRRVTTGTTRGDVLLVPRVTAVYRPAAAPEIAEGPLPEICATCMVQFKDLLNGCGSDEIRGVEGLPGGVVGCRAVARATAIRRAAIFAASGSCGDVCACRIGCWADIVGYRVLTALMATEKTVSNEEWLLQCYAVWTVMTFPVSVATVLSGFDLSCQMFQDEGAMGARDVLDC